MSFNLTRMTIYALLSSIEEDLRSLIKDHIKNIKDIDPALVDKTKLRVERDIGGIF